MARRAFQFPFWQFRFQQAQSPFSFATRVLHLSLKNNQKSTMLEHQISEKNEVQSESPSVVSGILFSRSVRSSFASFTLAPTSWLERKDSSPPFLVRLQFMDDIKELRSFCRRQYKIGDRIEFMRTPNGRWEKPPTDPSREKSASEISAPSWSEQPRWVVDLSNVNEAEESVVVREARVWSMKECQQHQLKYIPQHKQSKQKDKEPSSKKQKRANGGEVETDVKNKSKKNGEKMNETLNTNNHHGGGKEKRLQAQELISFFLELVGNNVVSNNQGGSSEPPTLTERIQHQERVRSWFNRADGVLDVAGGCGHVSMALGLEGISSTVVDARASVGKLPKRDRKIWKKSLKNRPVLRGQTIIPPSNNDISVKGATKPVTPVFPLSKYEYCQPVIPAPAIVPFQSQQAWFGSKPDGYDASFRHPDEEDIPVLVATAASNDDIPSCNSTEDVSTQRQQTEEYTDPLQSRSNSETILRKRVSALVALHPDEATGEIVEQAVKHRIPFVVVPCCVFARLFPKRTTQDGRPVSSYEDLLDFLQEKDPSIQRTPLSFGGKNIALWSIFPEG